MTAPAPSADGSGTPLVQLRLAGLAGAALLAIGGGWAGALPGHAPATQAQALWGDTAAFRLGLLAYLIGLSVLAAAWWRLGAAYRAGAGPPARWTLVTGALWAAPLLLAPPLGSRDVYAYACQGAVWLDGHDPYAVGAAAGGCPWLAAVPPLWQDATAPYGALALLVSAAVVALARLLAAGDSAQLLVAVGGWRLAAIAGMLLVAWFGPRLARACGVQPGAAAWLGLVTPLVLLHAVAGAHNDALVAGLLVAGLALAAGRASPGQLAAVLAGVALGLAAAVKITALAALPFGVLLAAGGHRRWPPAVAVVTGAVFTYAALSLGTGLGFGWVAALPDTGALVQWSSLPTGLGMAAGYLLWGLGWPDAYDVAVAVARAIGLVALVGLAMVMLRRAWRRAGEVRQVVLAAGVVLAAVVLLGPVVYPWYALAPLAVLAAAVTHPHARAGLAAATLVLSALVLPTGLGVPVLTKLPGALLLAVAVTVVSWWWLRRQRLGSPRRWRARRPAPDASER